MMLTIYRGITLMGSSLLTMKVRSTEFNIDIMPSLSDLLLIGYRNRSGQRGGGHLLAP
jgi:hypothetical protein